MPRKSRNTPPDTDVSTTNHSIFINNYPRKLCRERNSETAHPFVSVSFAFHDVWASFALPLSMISRSTKHNGDNINGFCNLFLGQPDEIRTVSVPVKPGEYEKIQLSNLEIKNTIENNRASYKAAHA